MLKIPKGSQKAVETLRHVSLGVSIHWRYLHQDGRFKWHENLRDYRKYSKATICRYMNRLIHYEVEDLRKFNKGRPPKLSVTDERKTIREFEKLRNKYGHFTSRRLKLEAGIPNFVSVECVCRVLRREKMKYTHSRKKGVLKRSDLKLRCAFAKKVKLLLDPKIWTEGIAFYLGGTGFTHKYSPLDQARSPPTMTWRRPADGLSFQRTTKGSHEGTGGKVAHFLLAIVYGKGVILAEQYEAI